MPIHPMSETKQHRVVRCFDEMHRLWWGGMGKLTLCSLLIFTLSSALGRALDAEWPALIAILVIATTFVIPRLLRIHRAYNRIACPACGHAVGNHETKGGRITLLCKHCGESTPTDCAIHAHGAPPTRIP